MKITKETHPEFFNMLLKGDPERVDVDYRRNDTFYCNLYQDTEQSLEYFKKALGDKWSDNYLGKWISNRGTYTDSWGLSDDFIEFYPCEIEVIITKEYKYKPIKDEI